MTDPDHTLTDLDWSFGAPRSRRFDDTYFSLEDGLAETRAVFLEGCGLPEAWAGHTAFTVGELGFGTGLNILTLADLWRQTRPSPTATLHVFSVEGFPMTREEAALALGRWPELGDLAATLLAQWPDGRRGWRRIEWPQIGVILDLAIGEVEPALQDWSGPADAWFLDGFAPARNPEMWTPEVLSLVAARSSPGARAASFTVAGAVRRGLADAGFAVERLPGFGRKKQRLEARLPGDLACSARPHRIAIIGAGIAGASLARAFALLGALPLVIEAEAVGSGASGNPAALVTPRLDAGLGPVAALHAQAFVRAVGLYRSKAPDAIIATGALQLEASPRDAARFAAVAAWDGFAATPHDAGVSARRLDEAVAPGSLDIGDGLTVDPATILQTWLGQAAIITGTVFALEKAGETWRLLGADGALVAEAEIVCLAGGAHTAQLLPDLPLRAVRGQASFTNDAPPFTGTAAAWGGYAIPTRGGGVLFGATHERDDWGVDARSEDDARNLASLREARPALAERMSGVRLGSRAALRAATRDHSPLAGAVPGMEGVYVLSGLGGRGFTLAPLLAEVVAAQALGRPSPLPSSLIKIVDPARFGPSA